MNPKKFITATNGEFQDFLQKMGLEERPNSIFKYNYETKEESWIKKSLIVNDLKALGRFVNYLQSQGACLNLSDIILKRVINTEGNYMTIDERKSFIRRLLELKVIQVFRYPNHSETIPQVCRCATYNVNAYVFNMFAKAFEIDERVGRKKEEYLVEYDDNIVLPDIDFKTFNAEDRKILKNVPDYIILDKLYDKYPQLKQAQELEEIMEREYSHLTPCQSTISPTITRKNGEVVKIGIRETNQLCQLHTLKHNPNMNAVDSRERHLKNYFEEQGGYVEIDIKGSQPRLAHFLITGTILPWDADPYWYIFSINKDYWDDGWNEDVRAYCKLLWGFLHYGERWYKEKEQFFVRYAKGFYNENHEWVKGKIPDEVLQRYSPYEFFEQHGDKIYVWQKNVDDFCGENKNKCSVLLLWESILYLRFRYRLLKHGVKCAQVYDCFFLEKDYQQKLGGKTFFSILEEEMNQLYAELNGEVGEMPWMR